MNRTRTHISNTHRGHALEALPWAGDYLTVVCLKGANFGTHTSRWHWDLSHRRVSSQSIIFCSFNFPTMSSLSHHPTRSTPPSSLVLQCCLLEREREKKENSPTTSTHKWTSPLLRAHTHTHTWQHVWFQPITFAWTCSFIHSLVNKGLPLYTVNKLNS